MLPLILLCSIGSLVQPQVPGAADLLAAGSTQVRNGDFLRALLSLNEAADRLADQTTASDILARVHAYRVMAYVGLKQPERARAAVRLALTANPHVVVAAGEFPAPVVALFDAARRPASAHPEADGRAAEDAGRFEDAFVAYLAAYRALPEPPAPADDRRLREKIIALVGRLATMPAIPAEAREHATRADRLLEAEAILGNAAGTSTQAAATELRSAVRVAPWWAEATFKLASVLQKLQRVDEALLNLNLYRLADPAGYAATAAKATTSPERPVAIAAVPKPAGPATIYLYWPEQQRGGGKQKVHCNGARMADLQNNRFVALKAAAGTHSLTFRDKQVTVVVEAGGEYYYRASIEGQWRFAMGPELRFVEADLARGEMREQAMRANDVKHTTSTQCVAAPGRNRKRD